jgi:curved DNA-binding protein CbpA
MRQDIQRHFTALGLSPGASANDIRVAYRKLIQQWHPDRFAVGSLMQTTAEDHTKELNEAYESLYKKRHYRKYLGNAGKTRPVARPAAGSEEEAETKPPETPQAAPRPSRRPPPSARRWWKIAALAAGLGASAGLVGFLLRSQGVAPRKPWATSPALAAAPDSPSVTAASPPPAAATAAPVAVPEGAAAPDRARTRIAGLDRPEMALGRPATGVSNISIPTADPLAVVDRPARAGRAEPARGNTEPPAPAARPEDARLGSSSENFFRTEPSAVAAVSGAEWDQRLDASEAELDTFEMGDSLERVKIVQGRPDETTTGAFRYGSSLVFFEKGKVSGWINGMPRLRIPRLSFADWPDEIDALAIGSTRGDVFKIQGRPDEVFADAYYYGTDAVYFAGDRVVNWIQTDDRLRTRHLPVLPFSNPPPR